MVRSSSHACWPDVYMYAAYLIQVQMNVRVHLPLSCVVNVRRRAQRFGLPISVFRCVTSVIFTDCWCGRCVIITSYLRYYTIHVDTEDRRVSTYMYLPR